MNPKYQQIIEWIQNRIAVGELSAGDKIESENQISNQFGMSRQTVRHALSVLIQEGILESRQGSGTYVRTQTDVAVVPKFCHLSHTVTIISTYISGYIFLRILKTMAETLEAYGYNVTIQCTNNKQETERQILEKILQEEQKGPMIVEPVMSGMPNPNARYYKQLKEMGVPILFFHTYYSELDIPHIMMDDEEAGRKATDYLISKGHTKIGTILKLDDGQGKRRFKGYIEAMVNAGLDVSPESICWIDTWDEEHLGDTIERLWPRLKNCSACLCYNDQIAVTMTDFAARHNIRVPEDLSLIGIDNAEIARLNSVPLTTIDHPKEDLGTKVAESMMRLIENPAYDVTYEFPVEVVERDSVKTIK